jgi:hypothetical protein
MIEPQYLGDSVYIQNDDTAVVLTTGSHDIDNADQVIYLEQEVIAQFLNWLERSKA